MSNFFIDFLWQSCVSRPNTWDVSNESTQVKFESNCENVNDKCNHPTFRWNVIATRACCLSGRHLSIVGDDEAALIEVLRAKTISRPIVVTTGIKPSSMSPVHLCRLCTGGAVGSEPTFTSAHQFDTLVTGISRPDLFCTAGIPAGERRQSILQVRHDLNSLSIGQPTNHHTIPLSNQVFQLDRWIWPQDPILPMVALVHLVPTSC